MIIKYDYQSVFQNKNNPDTQQLMAKIADAEEIEA